MHIDLNSCFATVEQQANPHLRGKPVAVAAYNSPGGCILAASVEAKRLGVKVGLRVKDGRSLCPKLVVLPPDPWKYRFVHRQLRQLLKEYTNDLEAKSIDEFALNLEGYPALRKGMKKVAAEIKKRLKKQIGDWLTVSIGIAPNRFLAKTASGLHKPDGLDEISHVNFQDIYDGLTLVDLCGIDQRNARRLNRFDIYTVNDFYQASIFTLKAAFHSIVGYYWYARLRGWEVDEVDFGRKSYGQSFALPKPLIGLPELAPILSKLVEKMGCRLRQAGYQAQGIHVGLLYRDWSYWHRSRRLARSVFDSRELYQEAARNLSLCPYQKPVRNLSVSCFSLSCKSETQLDFFQDLERRERLVSAMDQINERWGQFVLTPARLLNTKDVVHDRIAFGMPSA
jgi:DNA polymerase-4